MRRVLHHATHGKNRVQCLVGIGLLPLHAVALLLLPILLGVALDRVATVGFATAPASLPAWLPAAWAQWIPGAFADLVLVILAVAALEATLRYVARRLLIETSRRVEAGFKHELFDHLVRLPPAWFDVPGNPGARAGDLISRLTQDVENVRFLAGPLLLHAGGALLLLPLGFATMAGIHGPVTVAIGLLMLLLVCWLYWVASAVVASSRKVQRALGDLSQRAESDFTAIRTLSTQGGMLQRAAAGLAHDNRAVLVHSMSLARARAKIDAGIHLAQGTSIVAVVLGVAIAAGTATGPGAMLQLLATLGIMLRPLQVLGASFAALPRGFAAAERLGEILRTPPEPAKNNSEEDRCSPTDSTWRGALEVRGLTWPEPPTEPVLRDVSFSLEPGQSLALVGPVGAGKSSLFDLILRFNEPPRGTIFLDGRDVTTMDLATVRRQFAWIAQEPFLLSGTLAANVAFGISDDHDTRVHEAVVAAALDQDLEADHFADGLGTRVGERGVVLSGGQRQRVGLARVFATDRPGRLLDDPVSAMDRDTADRVLEHVFGTGATTLIATHRLEVARIADKILVLDRGRVVETGPHAELLRRGGGYAEAWARHTDSIPLEPEPIDDPAPEAES